MSRVYNEGDVFVEGFRVPANNIIKESYYNGIEQTDFSWYENGDVKITFSIPGKDNDGERFNLAVIRKLFVQIINSNRVNQGADRENRILVYEEFRAEPEKKMVLTFLFNGEKIADILSETVMIHNRVDMTTQTEKTLFKACFEMLIVIIQDYFGIERTWRSEHFI